MPVVIDSRPNIWNWWFIRWFRSEPEVLDHWYAPVPSFQTSAQEFYAAVEKELDARQVPRLHVSRVGFREGGLASGKREYLRMRRERLVFDVCAAPFGTAYFFSCWFAEIPSVIKPWEALVFLSGLAAVWDLLGHAFGGLAGTVVFALFCVACLWSARNAGAAGLADLDDTIMKLPVIGAIYDVCFRKDTYYRQDTRLMYLDTVTAVVQGLVEQITAAGGVSLVRFHERNTSLRDLYRERGGKPRPAAQPDAPPAAGS